MYKCPKQECNRPEITPSFWRESKYFTTETLDASGEVKGAKTWKKQPDYGSVRCSRCDARAEWRDQRQMEMFATEPEMFPS